MRFRTRHRRWIALWATLALLFAQLVVAAHACPLPKGPMQDAPSHHALHGDAAPALGHCPAADHADAPACKAHCNAAGQSDQIAKLGSVPPASVGPETLLAVRGLHVPSALVPSEPAENARDRSRRRVVMFGVRLI